MATLLGSVLAASRGDVRGARTPPAEFYTSGAVYAELLERVFARSWQWVGDDRLLAEDPSQEPFTLLPGSLDEPLVLTRDGDLRRCLSNVCTHRALVVCEAPGRARGLRCRYHGRRFGLDGRFVSAPGFEGALDFPAAADDLRSIPLESAAPLWFASLAPAVDFDAWWGPVAERLAFLDLRAARHDPARDRDFAFDAHWALYVENYLEGLHIPYIHPALNKTLEFETYEQILLPHGSLQIAEASDGEPAFDDLPREHPDARDAHGRERRVAAFYFWLFPNCMLNVYPWGLSLNLVLPQDVARTRVRFQSYVLAPERLDRGAGGDLVAVEFEDEAAVESVQRGLRSRLYTRGRYAPAHEQGTHHFHGLLARAAE